MTVLASTDDRLVSATAARRASVAVVDDDSAFAGYMRTHLALRGDDARMYTSGDEILAAIRRGARPDLVLLDVAMPGMDGLRTLEALKHARPDLQVVMLSGREQADTIVEALHLGATDYVVKPGEPGGLGFGALDAAITQALERARRVNGVTGLRHAPGGDWSGDVCVGWSDSPAMRQVAQIVEQVSDSDVTVLIRGESGVGKELVAREIHHRSARRHRPFVKVNCAALPADLLESELFGHERGAFTGAATARIGRFEQAHLGTMLLDEIGEMRPELQAKLLNVLQDGEITKLGSNRTIAVDVRVLAATNRDLEEMLQRGEFREDLYYRLKVIETTVPPLRERRDDILPLADSFLETYARRYGRPARVLSPTLRQLLQAYDWPGNVRELENTIKRLVILQDEQLATRELSRPRLAGSTRRATTPPASSPAVERTAPAAAPSSIPAEWENGRTLRDVAREAALIAERVAIVDALRQVRWNRHKAAQILRVSYKTLLHKIKETGIDAPPRS